MTRDCAVTIILVTARSLLFSEEIMIGETKTKISEVALRLFSQNGYPGTSMSDIAAQLGITKPALYKHYGSKREIFDSILKRMSDMDYERAAEYEMPEAEPDGFAEAYMNTPVEKIRAYSIAQFRHWTEDGFSSRFRKMLTIEQYNDSTMADLYQNYLAAGPAEYMARIFRRAASTDAEAMQLALEFYGPMFLLYSMYDGAKTDDERKSTVLALDEHIVRFAERLNTKHQTKVGP